MSWSRGQLLAVLAVLAALVTVTCGLRPSEEDFAFESDGDLGETPQGDAGRRQPQQWRPVQRQWGVQDTTAAAGKLLRFSIQPDAFSGDVDHYEAQSPNGDPLPSWLLFDQTTGLFEGVPTPKDVGAVYVTVYAISSYNSAKDKFSIDVLPVSDAAPSAGVVPLALTTHHHPKVKCGPGEDPLILSVVMDVKYDHMKPRQRLSTIDNLSGFLSLPYNLFQLLPQNAREDILSEDSILMAGEGNVRKRRWKQGSVIQWQVGCENQLMPQQANIVEDLKQQARDGTLAEVLLWPVVGWHIKADNSLANRGRREASGQHEAGSGNFAEDGATDDNEAGEGGVPDSHIVPTMSSPVYPGATTIPISFPHNQNSFTENPSQHHHRHRHGDLDQAAGVQDVDNPVEEFRSSQPDSGPLAPYLSSSFGGGGYPLPSSPVLYASIMPTPTLDPEKPTIHFGDGSPTPEVTRAFEGVEITPTPSFPTEVEPTTFPSPSSAGSPSYSPGSGSPSPNLDHTTHVTEPMIDMMSGSSTTSSVGSSSPMTNEAVDVRESTEKPVTVVDTADLYDPMNTTSTAHIPDVPSTAGTTIATSPPPPPSTTTTQAATTTTETIELEQKNFPPNVNMRLRKLPVTAGKILKYVVPDDTFKDLEDGNTRNLRLALKTMNGEDLGQTSWIQFNAARREIMLLPLEEHVSRWYYSLEATDKEGASVSDKLEVVVQHHQHRRAVNHEITLVMEPTALLRQQRVLQWEVVLVEALARLFGETDTSQITVRYLDVAQLNTNGSISLTYTNDSLPRTVCPHQGILDMLKVLRRNEDGDPSQGLIHALTVHAKHLNIRKVLYKGLANCETPSKPDILPGQPTSPDVEKNYPPVPRNQVDHINATVGMLLSYKVPEDSFYDPEDGTARAMKLSLLTMDHSPVPPDNWLQFDVRNQEFYGVPMPPDEGSREYQLVCEDRGGLRAHDGLVVVVHPAPHVPYSVEFSITINPHYETFIRNTQLKRKFVEKLRELFEEPDTTNIVLGRISKFLHISPLIGEVSKRPKRESKPRLSLEGSTVITWYNRTLPTSYCPNSEILRLRKVLVNDDNQMSPRLVSVMGPEFAVLAVGLYPTAICQGELTPLHPTEPPPPPVDELTPMGSSEEYLITFVVPAVIICTMLLLAGIVACVLYRRRRTGKMSVGDEDERQSFRNKGIPVIFQDELEDQTEPMNKSPVIMKEEKPPLPPPEYQRHNPSPPPTQALLSDAEDAEPYQPPPPFTTSRDTARHTRHKSTPTYRKPPPYVPP